MLERVTVDELREMLAEYSIEPWGEKREDLQAGVVASVIATAHGKKRYSPNDFMLEFDKKTTGKSADGMRAALLAFKAACERKK